jgi:hypothetical protein
VADQFYNTTNERGAELARAVAATAKQDELVLALFRKHAPVALSPSQAHRALATRAPLTSIRRAITNLTDANLLERTDVKVRGPYGRREHKWRVKGAPKQERLF